MPPMIPTRQYCNPGKGSQQSPQGTRGLRWKQLFCKALARSISGQLTLRKMNRRGEGRSEGGSDPKPGATEYWGQDSKKS